MADKPSLLVVAGIGIFSLYLGMAVVHSLDHIPLVRLADSRCMVTVLVLTSRTTA